MTGSGRAGELTFTDVKARLARVVDRVADVHAEADDLAARSGVDANVPSVTP